MNTKQYYHYLGLFRLFAVLMVMLCHGRGEFFATYIDLNPDSQNFFTQLFFASLSWSHEALAIIYVMCGFLIGGPFIEKLLCHKDVPNSYYSIIRRSFLISRLIKVFIPLFFAILLAIGVKLIGNIPFSWIDALFNLFGLQGVLASDFGGVFWVLALEIWFYVILYGLSCVKQGGINLLLGVLLLMISFFIFSAQPFHWFVALWLGVGAYFIKDYFFPKSFVWLGVSIAAMSKLIEIMSTESHVIHFVLTGYVNYTMTGLATAFAFAIILTVLSKKEPHSALLQKLDQFGAKCGNFTGCLFLTHFSIQRLIRIIWGQVYDVNLTTLCAYCGVCVLCILIGYIFYWGLVDKCGSKIRSIVSYNIE